MRVESSYSTACGVPLGGIGTGSVEIRADGRLYDWHIFNNGPWAWRREDKRLEILTPKDFFLAVRTKAQGGKTTLRLLQAHSGYVLGGDPYTLPWLKSVEGVEYLGEPPFAFLRYRDSELPVEVSAEAFSPLIPGDSKSSSTPAAAFVLSARNRAQERVEFSLAVGLRSPFSQARSEWEATCEELRSGRLLAVRGLNVPERRGGAPRARSRAVSGTAGAGDVGSREAAAASQKRKGPEGLLRGRCRARGGRGFLRVRLRERVVLKTRERLSILLGAD